jgi:hypothetical protein
LKKKYFLEFPSGPGISRATDTTTTYLVVELVGDHVGVVGLDEEESLDAFDSVPNLTH